MKTTIDGIIYETREVTVGTTRIEFRDLGLVDQWDLAEIAPGDSSHEWRSMSLVAMGVVAINGVPVMLSQPPKRSELRQILHKIGADGMNAVAEALFPQAPATTTEDAEAGHRAAVGEPSERPASGS